METLLNHLQFRTDELAERVYNLLAEIMAAKTATMSDGSFPLDSLVRQVSQIDASVEWITHVVDMLQDVETGVEVIA